MIHGTLLRSPQLLLQALHRSFEFVDLPLVLGGLVRLALGLLEALSCLLRITEIEARLAARGAGAST